MMKKYPFIQGIVIMLLILALQPDLYAQEEKKEIIRLAVIGFTTTSQELDPSDLNKIVAEWLTLFLVNTGKFEVIERQRLEKVLQEQSLGQTGVINAESAAQLGEVLGVKILVTGTLISFEETLEVTARLIDTTNGAIVGAASVTTVEKHELRFRVEELAEIISRKLSGEEEEVPEEEEISREEEIKVFESFDGDTFDEDRWLFEFGEEVKKIDQKKTKLTQEDGILTISGKYRKVAKNRHAGLIPKFGEILHYNSIEARIRVREIEGAVGICLLEAWNEGRSTTELCMIFEEEGGHVFVGMADPEWDGSPVEFDLRLDQWYVMRLEYRDNEFHYFWDDRLLKSIPPKTPVEPEARPVLGIGFDETKAMVIDIDEIVFR